MLSNCNTLSATRLERASKDFRGHINNLNDMKKDLESIFKRIRTIKTKLSVQHPEAFIGNIFLSYTCIVKSVSDMISFQHLEVLSNLSKKKMMNMTKPKNLSSFKCCCCLLLLKLFFLIFHFYGKVEFSDTEKLMPRILYSARPGRKSET